MLFCSCCPLTSPVPRRLPVRHAPNLLSPARSGGGPFMKRRSTRLHLQRLEDRTVPSSPGDIEWLRQIDSLPEGSQTPHAVDASGNFYIGGEVFGALPGQTSAGDADGFESKSAAAGTHLWTRQFGTAGFDSAKGIAVDA